jgi:hypothetical protein
MKYWAGLFPEETRNLVVAGTDLMVRVTKGILDGTRPVKRLKLLTGGDGMDAKQEEALTVSGMGDGA